MTGAISREVSEQMIKSASSIHSVIQEKSLRSVLRVSIQRYEYANEEGTVHVRLDTWPQMVKESGCTLFATELRSSPLISRKTLEQRSTCDYHKRKRKDVDADTLA